MATVDVSRIGSNIGAMNALSALTTINSKLAVHQTRLATGKQINSAADDPAGLTIATKLNVRSEGLKVAMGNISDAKNLLSVGEAGLGKINDILIQMRNKAEQAASDTMGDEERDAVRTQLSAFAAQIDDLVAQTKWNGKSLLNGLTDFTGSKLTFQTGPDANETNVLEGLTNVGASNLGVATVAANNSVDVTPAGLFTGATAGAGVPNFANVANTLSSGDYSVRVHLGTVTSGNSTADSYAQLVDSSGNAVQVDADGVDGGLLDNRVSFAYATDATETIDFGNGLRVSLATGGTTGTDHEQAVSFTQAGSYTISATDADTFSAYLTTVNDAINTVGKEMTKIGSLSSRLTFKEDQISAARINTEAAYNRIMNANMAEEQVEASKLAILQQTSTAMLAQANAAPQFLLSLFR